MNQFSHLKALLTPASTTTHTSPGSVSAMLGALRTLADRFLHLAILEGKQAGISLALMVGFAVTAAVLLITTWLALVASLIVALVSHDVLGWPVALLLAALLCAAAAGALVALIIARSKDLLFPATRRQLNAHDFLEAGDE